MKMIKRKIKYSVYFATSFIQSFFPKSDVKFIKNYGEVLDNKSIQSNTPENRERIIWIYWDRRERGILIDSCLNKIQELNPEYKINILSEDNIKYWLPDLIFSSEDIPMANKSDVIRLELLYRYGGIWIDASVIVNENFNWLENIFSRYNYQLVGFFRKKATIDFSYPVIESWFLAAPKGDKFIKLWLEELSKIKYLGSKKYFQVIKERSDYKEISQNITHPEYLLVYLAQQIAMRRTRFSYYLFECESGPLFFQEKMCWNYFKINKFFYIDNLPNIIPTMVKLTSADRLVFDQLYKMKRINEKSIIGELIKPFRGREI